jgi:hypothetical protein
MEPATSFQKIETINTQDRQVQPTCTPKRTLYGFGGVIGTGVAIASAASINQISSRMLIDCTNTTANVYAQVACVADDANIVLKTAALLAGLFVAVTGFSKAFSAPKPAEKKPASETNGHTNGHASTDAAKPQATNGHKAATADKTASKPVDVTEEKKGMAANTRSARRRSVPASRAIADQ